jgi:hypothetical protein
MIEFHWTEAYTLSTETSWTSGIYLALLTNAQNYQNYIIFVVRDDSRVADLLYQVPLTAWQAYNNYPNDGRTGSAQTIGGAGSASLLRIVPFPSNSFCNHAR